MRFPTLNRRRTNSLLVIVAAAIPASWNFAFDVLSAAEKPAAAVSAPKFPIGNGNFVSFENGVMTLDGLIRPSGSDPGSKGIVKWTNIDDNVKTYVVAGEDKGPDRGYEPAPTLETLKSIKPGTPIFVGPWFGYFDRPGIFVGSAKSRTVGTFVSYTTGSKASGLSLLGKDLTPSSFTKKYGNSLFMRGINEDTPVEESIDGGPFKPVGTVKTVLKDVKEGTVVTVHFHGEGNITLIQLGQPKE
ncbi:MAG: hypothetical protein ABI614_10600 [Planctomycetota bacterium]